MAKTPDLIKGWGGISILHGGVNGAEDNPDLTHNRFPLVAQRMLMNDPALMEAFQAHLQTCRTAKWSVQPGVQNSDFSKELASKAEKMFGLGGHSGYLKSPFEDIIAQLLLFSPIGFRYASLQWEYVPGFGYALVDVLDRDPTAHYKWVTQNGRFVGVQQKFAWTDGSDPDYGTQPYIPGDQLILLVKNKDLGNGLNGVGLLRPCYIPYKLKYHAIDIMGMGLETWGNDTFKIRVDHKGAEEVGYKKEDLQRDYEVAQEAVENYKAQTNMFLSDTPFVNVEPFGQKFDPTSPLATIRECDIQMAKAFLVNFQNLGLTDTGSRSVGEVQESFFRRAIQNDLDTIAGGFNGPLRPGGGVIARWASYAVGEYVPPEYLPKLKHTGLSPEPLIQMAEKFGLADVVSILKMESLQDVNTLRALAGLSALEDEGLRGV